MSSFKETTEAPAATSEALRRDSWAVEVWEQLQDVHSNEQAWKILVEARGIEQGALERACEAVSAAQERIVQIKAVNEGFAARVVSLEVLLQGSEERAKLNAAVCWKNHVARELDAQLSDALGHLEALVDFLPDVLTEDAAAKVAEATAFMGKHGHGPQAAGKPHVD